MVFASMPCSPAFDSGDYDVPDGELRVSCPGVEEAVTSADVICSLGKVEGGADAASAVSAGGDSLRLHRKGVLEVGGLFREPRIARMTLMGLSSGGLVQASSL